MDITLDIEANNLLNEETVDYLASPYVLKDSFEMHCIVVEEHETGDIFAFYDGDTIALDGSVYEGDGEYTTTLKDYAPIQYTHLQLNEFRDWVRANKIGKVIAHNGINYDLLVLKLYFGMDYSVVPDSWDGEPVEIEDTLVLSRTLNPDRFGGNSLDNLSKLCSVRKVEFRKHISATKRFKVFAPDMLYYCIYDVRSNTKVYEMLELERKQDNWDWDDAINLEKRIAEIVTRQEHRGFAFDSKLAEANIKELDSLMKERRDRVTPILPPKKATKDFMKNYTPPARQFLKNGNPSSYLEKFKERLGADIVGEVGAFKFVFNGEEYKLPLPQEPLLTEQPADIDDSTHIKDWLVGLGWEPSEFKDKDLTVKQVKGVGKVKRTQQEYEAAVDKYVEQTLSCNFVKHRCEHLETSPARLRSKLMSKKINRSVKVLTNPNFTKGQDKEMCPNLEKLYKDFPHAKDVVEYLTYKHRRNSILGGGLEWDDEDEAEKGYLAAVREDGRIPTPANTCGAATSRFKHSVVANIPRVTSLFGDKMRGLFGVDAGMIQVGYDFDSLEAKIESHYCWKWEQEEGKPYCNSLLQEKPNDVHNMMSRKISAIIGREFARSPAKNVKYGITYGSSAPKVAKIIGSDLQTGQIVYDAFWQAAAPLEKLKIALSRYWEQKGGKKFILGIDGRKVPTRSAHAILNSLFQSGGVICAKRAAVIHDDKIKKAGLHVDFFKDDWKSKKFCQQLIAYHDEAQLESTRESLKFKSFESEEAAIEGKTKEERETGVIWSDVFEAKGKWFIGYCECGELAVQAVKEAGEYYGLNVELTAGYMLGRNWKDCH